LLLNTNNSKDQLDRIEKKIVALCEAALKTKPHYLLSELGAALGDDLAALKLLTRKKLVDFVRERFEGRFEVVSIGVHRSIYAVIPAGQALVEEAPKTTSEKNGGVVERQPRGQRFHYRFWAAFSVPLSAPIRYLDPTDFTFNDGEPEEGAANGALTITPEYIAPADAENRDQLVISNINKWIGINGLKKDRFLAPVRSEESGRSSNLVASQAGISVLELVIDALDRRQLQTTSLSLDVVAALLRKRV
jgi:hypothetical protein